MIASWISRDNRKKRRTKETLARRAGGELAIHRITTEAVGQHIVTLTIYLVSPDKAHLDTLIAVEAARQHVVRYIGSQKQNDEPVSDAELSAAGDIANGERVRQVLTRNLLCGDLKDIQFEMAAVAGVSPGGEDPIEHIIVSWPEGEHPTSEQVEEVLDIVLAVAGMSRHQAFAVLHGDTANDHLHIALNRVDPVTGRRVQIGLGVERSIETLHQAISIVEHRQGWQPEPNGLYRADNSGCYERATGVKVRGADMYPCASSADQAKIRKLRAAEKLERRISAAARDYERRTGHESLQRRVINSAAPIFRQAANWPDLHNGLALEGMRYRMLEAGAVIECGDRTIAASTAWGNASAAKMVERIGRFEEAMPNLPVVDFNDRIIPKLYKVVQRRREQDRIRHARSALDVSVAYSIDLTGYRYAQTLADDPLSDTAELNTARQRASAEVGPLRTAIKELEARSRERLRRERRALRQEGLVDIAADEDPEAATGMLIGANAGVAPLEADVATMEHGYRVISDDDHIAYYREEHLVFVERTDRIDIHALDDDALRHALRIAQAKWGSVAGIGDRRFLDRLARLAVEENVTLTNPELQDMMTRLRAKAALERPLHALAAISEPTSIAQPVLAYPTPGIPAVLRDYAPAFGEWLQMRADDTVSAATVEDRAMKIMADPELAKQLAELETQQFKFAAELRRAESRRRHALIEKLHKLQDGSDDRDDDLQPSPPEAPGRSPDAATLEQAGVVLDASPTEAPAEPVARVLGQAPVGLRVGQKPITADPDDELDRQYRWRADRRLRKRIAEVREEIAAARRARVGDDAAPLPHIAALLLREANRSKGGKSSSTKLTDERDAGEIVALKPDPNFMRFLTSARGGDQPTIEHLRRLMNEPGDPLGRVPVARGRLNFEHRSLKGYDPGAQPPLEWINTSLNAVDISRLRLTRQDGLIGVFDQDLLVVVNHNYIGLHYPPIQARLEVEWRLQCARDNAVLYRIQSGAIEVRVRIDLEHEPYASIHPVKGATSDERQHIECMARDSDVLLDCRAAARGTLTKNEPRHSSPLVAAYLRAVDERADDTVIAILTKRLRIEKPFLEGMAAQDRERVATVVQSVPVQTPVNAQRGFGRDGRTTPNSGQRR